MISKISRRLAALALAALVAPALAGAAELTNDYGTIEGETNEAVLEYTIIERTTTVIDCEVDPSYLTLSFDTNARTLELTDGVLCGSDILFGDLDNPFGIVDISVTVGSAAGFDAVSGTVAGDGSFALDAVGVKLTGTYVINGTPGAPLTGPGTVDLSGTLVTADDGAIELRDLGGVAEIPIGQQRGGTPVPPIVATITLNLESDGIPLYVFAGDFETNDLSQWDSAVP